MIGKTLGHYRIVEKIGAGGMGVVYKALDTRLDRPVAIKVLSAEKVADSNRKRRFVQEAKAASALNHPNIIAIYDIDQTEGRDFIAMEYVPGKTLDELIHPDGLPLSLTLKYAVQITDALAKAHAAGIVHRDLKPSNIIINDDGIVKVLDFGLAKLTEQSAGKELASTATVDPGERPVTEKGVIVGTVDYMSPEQAEGRTVAPSSDIFSFGSVLYEMVTGRGAFAGDTKISTLLAIINKEPAPLSAELPPNLEKIITRCLRKEPARRYQNASELRADLQRLQHDSDLSVQLSAMMTPKVLLRRTMKLRIVIPALALMAVLVFSSVWFIKRQSKISWARNIALLEIERLVRDGWQNNIEAYNLALKAETYIPDDPKLAKLFLQCSRKLSIDTAPEGAKVYVSAYKNPKADWDFLGISPVKELRLPDHFYRCKIEKPGFETQIFAFRNFEYDTAAGKVKPSTNLSRILHKSGSLPSEMVYVSGGKALGDFLIDKYEVTNRQYKEFIDKGGYLKKEYWKNKIIRDGKELSWQQAMKEFVDQTGRPGPSTWNAGTYPNGQEDWPVNGVSWHEAAAYAEFAGKALPTNAHWNSATGLNVFTRVINHSLILQSNFRGEGPDPARKNTGIAMSGAFDMAGNVREWCWNEAPKGRSIRGGAWDDAIYMFTAITQAPAMDRSPRNGFRCVRYLNPDVIAASAFGPVTDSESRNFYKEQPVSEAVFQTYKDQFSYDPEDLRPTIQERREQPEWVTEKISFEAAYPGERMQLFLFLPKNAASPYQAVIYFPGSNATWAGSTENLEESNREIIRTVVTSRRAFVFPIYKGTYGRNQDFTDADRIHGGNDTRRYVEYLAQIVKDFKRSIDYLETRKEIDHERLAFYGFSWGGALGNIIPAVENRLKVSVLLVGGFWRNRIRPEADLINYVTRVRIPTLMLNGKYDVHAFPYETTVKPMFDLLGTPKEHKRIVLYETDHFVPRNELIKEMDAWLDKYLGRPN
jgi:serine/threonine protein kinase/dienelactone hydrolase